MARSSADDVEKAGGRMQRMPFLETGRSLGQRFYNYGRHFRTLIFFMLLGGLIVWVADTWGDAALDWSHEDMDDALTPLVDQGQALHILIPASHAGINLCKTVMGLSILGYSSPTLLGWKGPASGDSIENQVPTKITAALDYVKTIEQDDDLVVMVDAYDSWFQLPPHVLRARYFRLIEVADYRMRRRLGRRAVRRENMKQTVVFGASKACEPNDLSSIACYPVPEATTPRDMYGNDTDVIMEGAKYETFRPRYLDAGFMMGPVADVRRVLERAQELVETLPSADLKYEDEVSKSPAKLFGGDVQGIFNRIFGEQAWQREIIRQRYRSWFKKWSPPIMPGSIEDHKFKDITDPDFPHEPMEPLAGHPREYGINLDFSGSLVSNTAHSRSDHKVVVFDKPDQVQFNHAIEHLEDLKCPVRLKSNPPKDLLEAPWPEKASSGNSETWRKTKLFGNLCLGNVPVILHHNDQDKSTRERWWTDLWYQPLAKVALGYIPVNPEDSGEDSVPKGAFTMKGDWMTFDKLCPAEYSEELFREKA